MKSQKEINVFGLRVRYIPGFDGKYGISSEGDVINLHGEYLLKAHRGTYVYLGRKWFRIDYLVARAFVPNIKMCKELKHKDGDKLNNRADNLEWTDEVQLSRFGFGRPKVAVQCMDKDYHIIKVYPSVNSAAKELGLHQPNITRAARHGGRCGGYYWSMVLGYGEEKQ